MSQDNAISTPDSLKPRDRLDVLLKEYETLRSETLTRVTTRFGVAGVVFGAIGLSVSGNVRWWAGLALIGATLVIWYWIGRLIRMCSNRLREIEVHVNRLAGERLLCWELDHCKGRVFDWMYPRPQSTALEAGPGVYRLAHSVPATSTDGVGNSGEHVMTNSLEMAKTRYERADTNRRFEIELFWKRSAFFWGFLTAAFAAYFLLLRVSEPMALLVSCFGLVAAYVWYLANRASAYWQKVWEQNVMADEEQILGIAVYARIPSESELGRATAVVGWKRFSLSALITGFSLYTFVFWLALSAIPMTPMIQRIAQSQGGPADCLPLASFALSVVFLGVLHWTSTLHPSIPVRGERGGVPLPAAQVTRAPPDGPANGDVPAGTSP